MLLLRRCMELESLATMWQEQRQLGDLREHFEKAQAGSWGEACRTEK